MSVSVVYAYCCVPEWCANAHALVASPWETVRVAANWSRVFNVDRRPKELANIKLTEFAYQPKVSVPGKVLLLCSTRDDSKTSRS